MFKEIPGNHCEVCLIPAQEGFYKRVCRRFHGTEYLCAVCKDTLDRVLGNTRILEYLRDNDGCLFEELTFQEEKLGITFKRPERNVNELA